MWLLQQRWKRGPVQRVLQGHREEEAGPAHQHAGHVVSERRAMAEGSYLNSISPLARVSADGATLAMNHGHE